MKESTTYTASCLEKQHQLRLLFAGCSTAQQKYEKIIELGRQLPSYPDEFKTQDRLVKGCQSAMYLHAKLLEGKILFQATSDALISAGLAALLIAIYDGEPPEVVLFCPPTILEELAIQSSLTPGRSNGFASLFKQMKQEALKLLTKQAS